MRSAREIACTPAMGDCQDGLSERGQGTHSTECDARTEAILAAREDGARWALAQVNFGGPWFAPDVRKVAP